jgi:hypothetical protein
MKGWCQPWSCCRCDDFCFCWLPQCLPHNFLFLGCGMVGEKNYRIFLWFLRMEITCE